MEIFYEYFGFLDKLKEKLLEIPIRSQKRKKEVI